MARQFKRKYRLIVETTQSVVIIDKLRVSFNFTSTLLGYPNMGKLEITNLSKENANRMSEKFAKVTLEAGYEDSVKPIFRADLINFYYNRQAPQSTFTMILGSNQRSWQTSSFSKSFAPGVAPETIIQEVASSFDGVVVGSIETSPEWTSKLSGLTLTGSSARLMDDLARDYNFDWSEQDGEIFVLPRAQTRVGRQEYLITPFTGLIGTPVRTELGADFRILLNSDIKPGDVLELRTDSIELGQEGAEFREVDTDANGRYKVMETRLIGDIAEKDWYIDIIGWRIGNATPTKNKD